MSKVAFWNIQRNRALSANTGIGSWPAACDLHLACEVLDESDLARVRQAPRRNALQLGYKVVTGNGADIVEWRIDNYDALTGTPFWLSGGNAFMGGSGHSIRPVGQILDASAPVPALTFECFIYHSNSSSKGAAMTAWAVCDICTYRDDFVLMGDFNCTPGDLMDVLTYIYTTTTEDDLKNKLKGVQVVYSYPTHNAKSLTVDKTYDYIVNKGDARKVTTDDANGLSDHHPIVIEDGPGVNFDGTHIDYHVCRSGIRTWRTRWKRVYNVPGCVAWELLGD